MEEVRRWLSAQLQDGGRCAEEGVVWRFAGYQGRGMGRCDGWVWLGWRSAVSGVCGYGKGGAELSGNIISNYRTFKCERSERTYNFDYVRRKRIG